MATNTTTQQQSQTDGYADEDIPVDRVPFDFGMTRREAVKILGAGLLIAVAGGISAPAVLGQVAEGGRGGRGGGGRGGRGGGGFAGGAPRNIAARLHIGKDGVITVMTGKVEAGQGSRAEITQAAAEELRVRPERIQLIMADAALVPDDGMTAGSGTSPRTIPAVRQGAAAARELLIGLAAKLWKTDAGRLAVRDGTVVDPGGKPEISYADLASTEDAAKAFGGPVPGNVTLTAVKDWKSLGTSVPRPNGRDLVTGGHHFPSDVLPPACCSARSCARRRTARS